MSLMGSSPSLADRLTAALIGLNTDLGESLGHLVETGLTDIPLPGKGKTLERWKCLAIVAAYDLPLLKLYEGHTDALAIFDELNASLNLADSRWGVWAAEPPQARVDLSRNLRGTALLTGRKSWCSGAHVLSHALVTCWDTAGEARLAAVRLDQPGVMITDEGWTAVGMAATRSVDVVFDDAEAIAVGAANAYLERPGFWAGGIGIAACWYGAASAIAESLRDKVAKRGDVIDAVLLGTVDVALNGAREMLRHAAAEIDMDLRRCTQAMALRTRLAVEQASEITLRHVGHAVGAGPFCRDASFAKRVSDLPVFLRQSHAERDLAALGHSVVGEVDPWLL